MDESAIATYTGKQQMVPSHYKHVWWMYTRVNVQEDILRLVSPIGCVRANNRSGIDVE